MLRGCGGLHDVLLLVLDVVELLAGLGKARLELVDGVVEGLNLTGDLVDLALGVGVLLLTGLLHGLQRLGELVHVVGTVLNQVLHDAHALIEGLLHVCHAIGQILNLGLELNDFLGDGKGWGCGCSQQQGQDRQNAYFSQIHLYLRAPRRRTPVAMGER